MRCASTALLTMALCGVALEAPAEEEGRVYRLGFLWLGAADGRGYPGIGDVRAALRERGFVERRNLALEIDCEVSG